MLGNLSPLFYLSCPFLYSSVFMIWSRRMQWQSLFGSREIHHPDIGKLDDCPPGIKPKYSIVLNIKDSDWVGSGKSSKEWYGREEVTSCLIMRLSDQPPTQLSEPMRAFHVLLINSYSPWSEISGGIYFHPLPSDPYLVALLQVFDLTVLAHLLSNFKNLACSEILSGEKNEKTKTKKTWWP